ncbi:hypothetical protein [Vibrio vulnificus]
MQRKRKPNSSKWHWQTTVQFVHRIGRWKAKPSVWNVATKYRKREGKL